MSLSQVAQTRILRSRRWILARFAGQLVTGWPLRAERGIRRGRRDVRVGCCGQLRPVPVAGGRKAPPRNDQTEHFRAEPGHFAMSARFAPFVSTRSRTFVGRDMIAKLFRPMRMNILLHKKCFRDHRSRVSFGVTPPGCATPKAAVLASRDA